MRRIRELFLGFFGAISRRPMRNNNKQHHPQQSGDEKAPTRIDMMKGCGCLRGSPSRWQLIREACRPSRGLVIASLYVLTGLSVLTTYAFWDFVDMNSARGTLESPSSYIHGNQRGVSRGIRGVFDLKSRVNKELSNLFVIEHDASSFGHQMQMQDLIIDDFEDRKKNSTPDDGEAPQVVQVVVNRGSFSGNERPICQELDIPGLVGKRKVDLKEDMPMSDSENRIFGPVLKEVQRSVREANDILHKKLEGAKTGNVTRKVDWLFDSVIDSQAIGINKYWYLPGGHWKPMDCIPRWKVAIIIPFRDRFYHLPIVLRYLIPMLQRQFLEFSFFIVEQANDELFNRAMLMNVGFLEALNFTNYDCFVIHDVDHVPLDDNNYYGCSGMPRHFVSGADRWNYKLPYDNFFGAVTGLTTGQIRRINGFPNVYWGWGGEDDEIWKRVKEVGLEIARRKGPVGHYDVIRHHHKSAPLAKERYGLLQSFKGRYKDDGLSDIVYPLPIYTLNALYTNVNVDIGKIKPHYPMPAVKGVKKDSQNALMNKMKEMTLKARKAGGPNVRVPEHAKQKPNDAEDSPKAAEDSPKAEQVEDDDKGN